MLNLFWTNNYSAFCHYPHHFPGASSAASSNFYLVIIHSLSSAVNILNKLTYTLPPLSDYPFFLILHLWHCIETMLKVTEDFCNYQIGPNYLWPLYSMYSFNEHLQNKIDEVLIFNKFTSGR